MFADNPADLLAIHVRYHNVQYGQMDFSSALFYQLKSFPAIMRQKDVEVIHLQKTCKNLCWINLIFNKMNGMIGYHILCESLFGFYFRKCVIKITNRFKIV